MNAVHFHFSQTETLFNTPVLPLVLSEEERHLADQHWQQVNIDGRFFNGMVLAGTAIEFGSKPTITISISDYAHYLYSNAHPDPAATPCRVVYCAAAMVTSDNHILVGEMASSTASPGRLQFVGGNVEMALDGTISALECCKREVVEEVGRVFLEKARIFQPLCIKTGGKADHIGVYYFLRLTTTAEDAKAAFENHLAALRSRNETTELVKIHLVDLAEMAIGNFCTENAGRLVDYLTPLLTRHLPQLRTS